VQITSLSKRARIGSVDMCWALEGDEIHINAHECFLEEKRHLFKVVPARLWGGTGSLFCCFALEISEST
jgi:hypothetical protein